jgi:WhiB family redox-sensing transcriptional regulator
VSWHEQAACRGRTDVNWFPTCDSPGGVTREHRANIAVAKAICAGCQVRDDCLQDALRLPFAAGVWGATTEHERIGMPKQRLRAAAAICGTDSGYYRHRRNREATCAACRAAHADAARGGKAATA